LYHSGNLSVPYTARIVDKYALYTIIGMVVVVGALAVLLNHRQTLLADAAGAEAHWHDRIAAVGGEAAYQELGRATAGETQQTKHEQAHAFGGELFTLEGVAGLSVCDSSFDYGCYHEFLGRAIAAMGLSALPLLDQACFSALANSPLSCQHGLGHGIVASLGYTSGALQDALAACHSLPDNDPIAGCDGGVFMEYNFATMLVGQARTRPLGADPFAPCSTLAVGYRAGCYFWQPQWWIAALQPDTGSNIFAKMGEWCAQSGTYRTECFEGIGYMAAPESGYVEAKAAALCASASAERPAQDICIRVAGGFIHHQGFAPLQGIESRL